MARLTDADALKDKSYPFPCAIGVEYAVTIRAINEAPTIDTVHAAGACYCRECEYFRVFENGLTGCFFPDGGIPDHPRETDFCSYGNKMVG